jgi:Nucleotidyl transferase AbiEii toxin, Type IV TA system
VDKAVAAGEKFIDNRALAVKCYDPAFTLVEKLQAVSTKFRKQQESGDFAINFLRHYYDIYCLLADPRVQKFIGTDTYEERKEKRFPKADVRHIAENDAFILSDREVREQYKGEYAKTAGLYYTGMVPFETILDRIKENFDRL